MSGFLEDLRRETYVARTPAWMATYAKEMYAIMIQSAMIHPDWTLDDVLSYMIHEEYLQPVDMVGAVGGRVDDIATLWVKAKAAAKDALKRL